MYPTLYYLTMSLFHSSQNGEGKLTASAFKYCDWKKVLAASLRVGFYDEWKRALMPHNFTCQWEIATGDWLSCNVPNAPDNEITILLQHQTILLVKESAALPLISTQLSRCKHTQSNITKKCSSSSRVYFS